MPLTGLTKRLLQMGDEELARELETLPKLPAATAERGQIRDRIAQIQDSGYEKAMQAFNRLDRKS